MLNGDIRGREEFGEIATRNLVRSRRNRNSVTYLQKAFIIFAVTRRYMSSTSSLSAWFFLILLILTVGAIPATQISTAAENNAITNTSAANQTIQQNGSSIQFGDQQSDGTTVIVMSATLPEGGFIVIHEAISNTATPSSSSPNPSPPTSETMIERRSPTTTVGSPQTPEQLTPQPVDVASIIGVSEYLDPGTHRNVTVDLFNASGKEFDRSQLTESQDVASAELHRDTNNNNQFDFLTSNRSTDTPYYVPYLMSGDRVIQKGPIIDNAVIAIGEDVREAQGLGPTPRGTAVAAGGADGSNGSAAVQTQADTGVSTDSATSERTGGSGPGFGVLIAVVAILSTLILTQRI